VSVLGARMLKGYYFPPALQNHAHCLSQGKYLFLEGVQHLSTEALEEALQMKRAGRETRRLRALASAWEIKEVEHYSKLMRHMHKTDYMNYKKYEEYLADEDDTNTVDGLVAYNHELYNEQLLSLDNADSQLDQLEEVMKGRIASISSPYETDGDSDEDAGSGDDDKIGDRL